MKVEAQGFYSLTSEYIIQVRVVTQSEEGIEHTTDLRLPDYIAEELAHQIKAQLDRKVQRT